MIFRKMFVRAARTTAGTTLGLIGAAVVVAGCGNSGRGTAGAIQEPAVEQPTPVAVGEMLARDVGKGLPVAVFSGPGGIDAISADGTRTMKLVASSVAWATVDTRSDVIWFGAAGAASEPLNNTGVHPGAAGDPSSATTEATTLYLIDLRQPTISPVTIATNLPPDVEVGFAYYNGDDLVESIASRASEYDGRVEVRLGQGKPAFVYSEGVLAIVDEEATAQDRAATTKATFTPQGLALLESIAKRAADTNQPPITGGLQAPVATHVPPTPAGNAELPRVAAVRSSNCEDRDMCGRPDLIPGTRFWRVIVEQSCGDGCYATYQMYEPATAEFFDLKNPAARSRSVLKDAISINEIWVSPNGASAIFDGALYDFSKGLVKADLGRPAGWIGGGWYMN